MKNLNKNIISKIFAQEPSTWGLRGDPHLWDELQIWLQNYEIPDSSENFSKLLEKGFEEIVGKSISEDGSIYIERFDSGGMSRGHVNFSFWREKGIPHIVKSYEESFLQNKNTE